MKRIKKLRKHKIRLGYAYTRIELTPEDISYLLAGGCLFRTYYKKHTFNIRMKERVANEDL